jgi:hypothetical protein
MANRRRQQDNLRAGSKLIRIFQIFFLEHFYEILMLGGQMLGVNAAQMILLILLESWNKLVVNEKPRSTP